MEEKPEMRKIILGLTLGVIILGMVVYAGYLYAKKYGTKITLPGGQTYLGQEAPESTDLANPPTAPLRFTAEPEVPWTELKGKTYPYTFEYPETLSLGVFPNDPNDSVAIIWGNIPPERNIFLNIENVSSRNPAYVGNLESFARNWWQFFSGLSGLRSIESFTSAYGLTGYRAVYTNTVGQSPNIDVFFAIPNNSNKVIHLANGILDPAIFERIVASLRYQTE